MEFDTICTSLAPMTDRLY